MVVTSSLPYDGFIYFWNFGTVTLPLSIVCQPDHTEAILGTVVSYLS